MSLKERIKSLAQERGISLPALEAELGFGNSTIVKWDKSTPNADKLNAVAKYFGVSMDYLLNGIDSDGLTELERVKLLCKERKIPISKLEKDLGYSNGYIGQLRKGVFPSDRLQKIAKYLDVSVDYLMTGKEDKNEIPLTAKDQKDIEKILDQTREQLMNQEGLMFDGDPASPEAIESILSAMEIGMEMAKKKNKEKYTPKKYRKD